jgi:F-type H+-transporting ATPase subunit b
LGDLFGTIAEGAAGLGVSKSVLVAQVINFVILFGLLFLVAYRPLTRMFDERHKRIKDSMKQTEMIKEQAERAEEEVKKQLEAARKEGQEVVNRAVRTGEELRRETEQQAKQEGEVLVNRARVAIQRERDEAIGELRKEFADLTILAAEKVIDRSLDRKAHRELIDKVLGESETLKEG